MAEQDTLKGCSYKSIIFPVLLCLMCINKVFHIPPAFLLCWLQACLYLHDRPTIASLTLHSDVIRLLFTSLGPVWHYSHQSGTDDSYTP